jgi:hypothetical protein
MMSYNSAIKFICYIYYKERKTLMYFGHIFKIKTINIKLLSRGPFNITILYDNNIYSSNDKYKYRFSDDRVVMVVLYYYTTKNNIYIIYWLTYFQLHRAVYVKFAETITGNATSMFPIYFFFLAPSQISLIYLGTRKHAHTHTNTHI